MTRAQQFSDKVAEWTSSTAVNYDQILSKIDYFSENFFGQYLPGLTEPMEFRERLREWVEQAGTDAAQQLLLRLVPYLFFVGIEDYHSLCRSAFTGPIFKWLIARDSIAINSPTFQADVEASVRSTWFLPATDSMRIASFYNINGVEGVNLRPDVSSLNSFGDFSKIKDHIGSKKIKGIVVLEDFVGSGLQILSVRPLINDLVSAGVKVLICPLICCPTGHKRLRRYSRNIDGVSYESALNLRAGCFLTEDCQPDASSYFDELRVLMNSGAISKKVLLRSGRRRSPNIYGFRKTGGLVVLYSNTPNNTLPLIHRRSSDWKPLFHRSHRI